jgi:membrane-bound ClpP family serine protease
LAAGIPQSANDFIEQQLNERCRALGEIVNADVLTFSGPIVVGVDDLVRVVVEGVKGRPEAKDRLAVVLTTLGGYIEVVHRIVDTLRHHYPKHVEFIVPNSAFSAGTVLVMSGDVIRMNYYSRLGPIDPQVENNQGRMVPALGYLIMWERLLEKANNGTLTTAEAQLMIDGFDQAALYAYEQARELSVRLLREWLAKYKFKNWAKTQTDKKTVTAKMRETRAEQIARQLNETETWHSHGYGISIAVLRNELNLLIG